ncbi:PREDICTED: ubiquitin carboxyl-terminal hydrolase 27 isoform X2 [Ipomoea nil]|uniref:ubiquitin carboxyl-terminal hydrolase 27 isoform X2 n=1 Tax=Ipomoea nil TaxID=35883 RepID=UPI000901CF01|nr:PREDICTED: ubiquitin carboxyl-terminal hydrolase 27 isoform X2 [Ipomoea nil]
MKIHGVVAHKFSHGLKLLPRSASGLQVSVAATVLGVLGLVYAVKDGKFINFLSLQWSLSSSSLSEDSWVVPGLQNLGNNCFLNVVLQALASCKSFRTFLERTVVEFGESPMEGSVGNLSFADALFWLLEELSTLQHGRTVLSPRKLMLAMNDYIPNFNLTSQQDAEEALSHLLSSLREELSESYVHECSSLADVTALPNCRVLALKNTTEESEFKRWREYFIGPFDGILCSSLMCQSCSFQISLDFQLFQSLHLLPVVNGVGRIVGRCSVEDCLKQFFVAEQVENYCCNHCWHIAAIKYVSAMCQDQTVIEKLKLCLEQDSCDCKELSCLRALPWSNQFSHTFKQFSIAQSPQILCIHLQRASVNVFGELDKLQGHISFPLILDMSPFSKTQVGTKKWEREMQIGLMKQQDQQPFPRPNYLNHVPNPCLLDTQSSLDTTSFNMPSHPHDEGGSSSSSHFPSVHTKKHIYRLVSVVQHFGRVGSGHYVVYRRVAANISSDDDPSGQQGSGHEQWYCISDSEVHSVSENDVLDAEANLLFYEKVSEF